MTDGEHAVPAGAAVALAGLSDGLATSPAWSDHDI
jgi:hypothetical protein